MLDARFFKALCDPNRIALLRRLAECGRPCTVTEMSECCPACVSVVSRHLAMLKEAGILTAEKRGKEVYYSVRSPDLATRLRDMADAIEGCCRDGAAKRQE
ncbi:MAG TPA: metalloregulator ArsR/SmtB family transcription factor [Phycisphaerae bacterium]|nr:metalloregulator ArsR/SmtB family transcription factor [Phycisphaerae bacterium]